MSTTVAQLRALTTDERLLFATRTVRLFAYGFLSIVFVLYLAQVGLSEAQIGLLLTLTLLGDTLISLWITTSAVTASMSKLRPWAGVVCKACASSAGRATFSAIASSTTCFTISFIDGSVTPLMP